ncbi:hypothetical protein [Pediococcus claussenii]|uniref:Uncharacterized protein n=1 Tax=Pediococcus claussenii (strain ATCC BAA-344 / DSM 14800 / JCM 18046 / KCTC 3811 / LMG 21948 / P06) TaxID=701521 RepID=G8PAE6_PEDCP|nr:hypothetical protein [Pediococcus claussenii]AEV95735.1 hypothetical protein PECL_1514 [Pediococcus claussenii ATCC BAA-344]ANZ69244.1 hypothetical protein AYR57_02530 [Pediococcus claussenii]ANZ71063.1 hypothetical protein AYR58_02545 [Pediococcus claussenii]KRN20030.1 hypothetical protein IV79_GL000693 [Pediococcus claussenii]
MVVGFDRLNDNLEVTASMEFKKSSDALYDLPVIQDSEICEESTYYIHDITAWNDDGNKTIVFDSIRGIHRTDLSTRSLINKFLQDKSIEAMINRILGEQIGIKQAIPLIVGSAGLAPLAGTSRSSTHWVSVHHLLDLHFDSENSRNTIIKFKGCQLHVPIKCKALHIKLQQTIKMRQVMQLIFDGISEKFGLADKSEPSRTKFKIDDRLKKEMMEFKLPEDAFIDFLTRVHLLFCETLYEDDQLEFSRLRAQVVAGLTSLGRI